MSARAGGCALLALVLPGAERAPAAELPAGAAERLDRAARLWGEVRFRHPWVLTKGVDWDGALLRALPRILDAKTVGAERVALSSMLGALGDPATRMVRLDAPRRAAHPLRWRWARPGVLVIARRTRAGGTGANETVVPPIREAKAVILDLRDDATVAVSPADACAAWAALDEQLIGARGLRASVRHVHHSGYRPQLGTNPGGFETKLVVDPGERDRIPDVRLPKIAALVDRSSPITSTIAMLHQSGRAPLIATGDPGDRCFTTTRIDLSHGLVATVRTSEAYPELRADLTLRPTKRPGADAALAAALEWIDGQRPLGAREEVPAAARSWEPDATWPDARPPTLYLRLLALVRMWNVIRFFDPYLDLVDEPWDGLLARHAAEFAAAETPEAYERAVRALAAHLQDSHVRVIGPAWRACCSGRLPATVRPIEGRAVVVSVEPGARSAGLTVGDVLERVDGKRVVAHADGLRPTTAASTPAGLASHTLERALAGPPGSAARLEVLDANDQRRTVSVRRTRPEDRVPEPPGLPWRWATSGVGYVDLTRLSPGQVDPMLAELARANAIVFDMRGYPRGVMWTLAQRLHIRAGDDAARFRRRVVGGKGGAGDESATFPQRVGDPVEPLFRGRTVMLIDERTISQAEHTGLFLEQAAGTVFVGTPSAGADGDVTVLTLPGGLAVSFSGQEVRHADGRRLQRIGLQPIVRAEPTLLGVRRGRDEVLDAALDYLARLSGNDRPR
jgi:C-terminal processing protease CtpA/Prc